MTSVRIGSMIKNLMTVKEMWEQIKKDATTKSTLFLIDAEDQLSTMHLTESNDPQTHLNDLKQHFEPMMKHHDNLMEMGSSLSTTQLSTIIISSLPSSYRSVIQTITAAERIGAIQGTAAKPKMTPQDLISFFTEEAQHHLIHDECTKEAESALVADQKRQKKSTDNKGKTKSKLNPNDRCKNCNKNSHLKIDCWAKGGGKEGQGLRQKKVNNTQKLPEAAIVADAEQKDKNIFAFTCTSNLSDVVQSLDLPRNGPGACIDSGVSSHYCTDRSKFKNYCSISGCDVMAADGRSLKALGISDVLIDLPNGSGKPRLCLRVLSTHLTWLSPLSPSVVLIK